MLSATVCEYTSEEDRHLTDDEALDYQVEFIYWRRPIILEARGVYSLFHQMFDDGATRDTIRKCLERVPRHKYELLYQRVYERVRHVSCEGSLGYFKRTKYADKIEFLPYSYNWQRAEFLGIDVRQAMLLPDRTYLHSPTEAVVSSRIRRSRVGASAKEILAKFKGGWRIYVNSPVKTTGRGRIIYAIACGMADQGATADEIETVVRSSRAFQSKSGPFSEGGQGRRWGEQEIQRMRRLAR